MGEHFFNLLRVPFLEPFLLSCWKRVSFVTDFSPLLSIMGKGAYLCALGTSVIKS